MLECPMLGHRDSMAINTVRNMAVSHKACLGSLGSQEGYLGSRCRESTRYNLGGDY